MNNESRQVIIVRKDLEMSVGKTHASMAFLTTMLKNHGKNKAYNIYPVWEDYAMTKPVKFLNEEKNKEARKARAEGRRYISWPTNKTGYAVTPFDIDKEIVNKEKMSINEIFELKGEDYFREIERELYKEYAKRNGLIISTGGGIVKNIESINRLKENGMV